MSVTGVFRAVFIVALVGLFTPSASGAEEKVAVRRVGVLSWRHTAVSTMVRDGIREGLLRTRLPIQFEEKECGEKPENARAIVDDWVHRGFALFLAADHEAANYLKTNIPDKPIVFASIRHPVLSGITNHLGPGRANMTGVFLKLDMRAVIGFFRAVIPGLDRIGILHSVSDAGSLADVRQVEELSRLDGPNKLEGIRFERVAVKDGGGWADVEAAIEKISRRGVRALWLPDDRNLLDLLPRIAAVTNRRKIALIGTHPHGVRRHMTLGV
jgi:ABC-type uncharacterized transport system substrate-binding protein